MKDGFNKISFEKIPVALSDLSSLTKIEQAFLALTCQAATDLNILSKSLAALKHPKVDDEDIRVATTVNLLFALKLWTSKLFEYSEFLTKLAKRKDLGSEVKELIENSLKEFNKLKSEDGYEFSKRLRNESSFHYGFRSALDNIDFASPDANCSLYYGKRYVNSYFPMGDEIMIGGLVENMGSQLPSDDARKHFLERAIFWANDATKWAKTVQVEVFNKSVVGRHPNLCSEEIVFELDGQFVGSEQSLQTIFLAE